MVINKTIVVKGTKIAIFRQSEEDYISLTGIARHRDPERSDYKEGRDYASLEQLVVLSNMESINAVMLHQGLPQSERIVQLNNIAINQLKSLAGNNQLRKL